MHTDEAVNAYILGSMLKGESYRYDPQDKHGPVLHYATYPLVRALGPRSHSQLEAWQLRLIPALFGASLLLLLPLLGDGLPKFSYAAAALWLSLGAPLVYYGRYWIHETIFVFLTLLLIAGVWRFLQSRGLAWALLAGLSAGLMAATKETVSLSAAVGLIAVLLTSQAVGKRSLRTLFTERQFLLGFFLSLSTALLCAALFYSSFGAHPEGLVDVVRGAVRFVGRAGGEGHEKPWFTYLSWSLAPNLRSLPWFGWTLTPFLAVGAWSAWQERRERGLPLFLLLFGLGNLAVYSLIPYKTPWLQLNFLVPLVLVAAVGVRVVLELLPRSLVRWPSLVLFALLTFALGRETQRLCFRFPADSYNPLAYSPSVPDVLRLQTSLEAYAATRPEALSLPIQVVGSDLWPLPWYLRHFAQVGFWEKAPDKLFAPVIICSALESEKVAKRLGEAWSYSYYGLRPEFIVVVFTKK